MANIKSQKVKLEKSLELLCIENSVSFVSMKKLIEAERTKKLLKRNAFVQQTIDKEIDNSIQDENKNSYNN